MLEIVRYVKEKTSLSYHAVCGMLDLSYSNIMRWQVRLEQGRQVINTPGPSKVLPPVAAACLDRDIRMLTHGKKRTQGTTDLLRRYAPFVSRRDFYYVVRMARYEYNADYRHNLRRIHWQTPGMVWAMDDTEFSHETMEHKVFLHHLQDVAARYKFQPIVGDFACGDEIAAYLASIGDKYGDPLFIKRDNHSNLNCQAVDELLDERLIIPINNPPYYAPYNGGMEKAQQELKKALAVRLDYKASSPGEHMVSYAENAITDLNHMHRPCLNGKTACQTFFGGKDKIKFTKKERRAIYDWILNYAYHILAKMERQTQRAFGTAWRIAVETWLRWKGFIFVSINGKVLPNLSPNFNHN